MRRPYEYRAPSHQGGDVLAAGQAKLFVPRESIRSIRHKQKRPGFRQVPDVFPQRIATIGLGGTLVWGGWARC